jgi:hypothetical protein
MAWYLVNHRENFSFFFPRKLGPILLDTYRSWDSAGLRAAWSGVRVPGGAGNFPRHHCVQSGSGAHPASYPMGTRGSFLGGKAAGAWSWLLTSI